MIAIPAIDLLDNCCVRLSQGDYNQVEVYSKNPLDVAKEFEDQGITHLHLVDLEGAKTKQIAHHKMIETIVTHTSLKVDVGGGVKDEENFKKLIEFGAQQVNIGSMAVENQELFISIGQQYGWDKVILSADVKNEKVTTHGWLKDSQIDLLDFLAALSEHGLQYATVTDVAKDGMLTGTNVALYQKILDHFPKLNLIASGGVKSIEDLYALKSLQMYGCIIGKAYYEGHLTMHDIKTYQDAR